MRVPARVQARPVSHSLGCVGQIPNRYPFVGVVKKQASLPVEV
jgi:hypothetical protein